MTMHVLSVFADRMGGWEKIKIQGRPAAFKGYGVAWSRDHSIVTLHMTTHIEALAKEWVPELFDDVIPSDILSGNKLTQAADSLELVLGHLFHFVSLRSSATCRRIRNPPQKTTAEITPPMKRSGKRLPNSKTNAPDAMTPMLAITSFAENIQDARM